jgi:integrase
MGKLEMTRNIRKIDFKVTTPVVQQNASNPDLLFRELAAAWLATIKQDNEHCQLRKWLDLYGDRIAWSITTAELDAAGQALLQHGYSAATVNRNISTLGSMYKWIAAVHRAPAGFTSPTLRAARHLENMRVITIEAVKVQALRNVSLTFSDKRFALFVNLLADTGARKSELLERTWADFDLDAGTILLETSKTGVPRVLHFTPATAALIQRLAPHRPADALAFPGRVPSVPINYRSSWKTLTASVGLPDLHMHDLRHDKARSLLVAGVTLPVAASLMGHSPVVLARRYGHLATADTRRAAEQAWAMAAA